MKDVPSNAGVNALAKRLLTRLGVIEARSGVHLTASQVELLVTDMYRLFAGRQPDADGMANYTKAMLERNDVAEVLAAFVASPECRARRKIEVLTELQSDAYPAPPTEAFPRGIVDPFAYKPPGEAGRSYQARLKSGFLRKYCSGSLVLDVGFSGYDNPERKTALPNAIGIDLDYPGYDGVLLPFEDGSVDTIFSSHCLEHILFDHAAIRDWHRVLKVGGFIVCMVPSQALYEKKRFLPSAWNADHKRMYTPAGLMQSFEVALPVNSYRVRHLAENDTDFNYDLGPEVHSDGAYEIEIVIEKIKSPEWAMA